MDALARVRSQLRGGDAVVAGVLSGTSGDGIDVALTSFPPVGTALGPPTLLAFATEPFPRGLAARVRAVLDGEQPHLAELARLSRDLGLAFGAAARETARRAGHPLTLVGSHGQTVYHHDGQSAHGPATLQLGEPAFVAEAAGACVVADFRQADLAAGGEGAPLSALADEVLFADAPRPCAVLNLGGMANVTLLPDSPDPPDAVQAGGRLVAFDTGPAGSLLDGLARRLLRSAFDRDGACAARGRPHEGLVAELLAHPFFERAPPKSTGRDTFGEPWVDAVVRRAGELGVLAEGPQDLFATAVAFVARSVADALERFVAPPPRLVALAGGGARNAALARAIAAACGRETVSVAALGVDPDAREGLVFAVLAARAVLGQPSTDPGATGAAAGRVLGAISVHAPFGGEGVP